MSLMQKDNKRLLSLRSRYLLLAGVVAVLLLLSAVVSNVYTHRVTDSNIEALTLRDTVSRIISDINLQIRNADAALTSILTTRIPEYEKVIAVSFSNISRQMDVLSRNVGMKQRYNRQLEELNSGFHRLYKKVGELIIKRRDSEWIYPALPYVSRKMLEPNNRFQQAVSHSLQEIADEDEGAYRSELYGRFDRVGDLWLRMILEFRATLVRFLALNQDATNSQERNVDLYYAEIRKQLSALQKLKQQGKLGIESEQALTVMLKASADWYSHWKTLKAQRASTSWRRDIAFLNTEIIPLKQKVILALASLEKTVHQWSANTADRVQKAAGKVSLAVWGLAGLAMAFVLLVYFMINRMVLKPVSAMAAAIEENESAHVQADDRSSREIFQLVTAFNGMRKQIHQRQVALEHQALHDSLTGLPNRALLQDRLEQAIQIMKRNQSPMALLILDLDRFKDVNDALGHTIGDRLLQHVGQRLAGMLRESDTVARLGGDEFAIVAPNTDAGQAAAFAEKIVEQVRDVFQIDAQNLYVGVSIGVAVYPDDGLESVDLVRNADIAMYHAKRNNLGYSLYDSSQGEHSVDKLALVGDLHQELQQTGNLQVYFQPLTDLMSHEVVAVEALLRWPHPQLGQVSPEHIINMAEHTGMIGELTEWVMDTAFSGYSGANLAAKGIKLSINLSAWNLQDPDLPVLTEKLMKKHNMPIGNLMFEITETAMMNDPVRAREVLVELDEMGIELSVDDYGTGFSSLGYLKMLPVRDLKIDRSFVADMMNDENDAIIVHSTIELAHNLGLQVVAEGVEDQETLLRLRKLKCDVAQGYHISKPLPLTEFCGWLENYKPRIAQ